MARKYTRDNRGRFASSGTGATARGGRLRTATGNKRATQTSRMTAAPRAGTVDKGGKARGVAKPADKPAGRLQSPAARKDRVELAKERKSYAGKLRALPKEARRAIQIEKMSRGKNMGNQAKPMTNIAEGRMRLIGNVGKRKNKLSPGEVSSIAKSMSSSAQKLKAGLAMGNRGRARYNPNAVGSSGSGSAARKIQGAASRGTVAKPKGLKQGAVTARVKAKAVAAKPAAAKAKTRKKTDEEVLFQASRIIGKANKRSAAAIANVSKIGFQETARQVRRNNYRSVMLVPKALKRRGLLETYAQLTAPADGVNMRRAGPGIKQPRRRR
jgi:hypothetical protein